MSHASLAAPAALLALALGGCSAGSAGTATGAGDAFAATPGKSATFDAKNEVKVTVPDGAKSVRIWMAMPQRDAWSAIDDLAFGGNVTVKTVFDDHGNAVAYAEIADPKEKELSILESFRIRRSEIVGAVDATKARPLSDAEKARYAAELGENANIKITPEMREIAAKATGGETNPVLAARKLYDWVLDNIDYWVKDPDHKKASPVGSSEYCLSSKTGNCTDFHSLWTALARASGIPTRMVYGSIFKPELDGQDKDASYHCWPEFYAAGIGWVAHDVAVADIFHGKFDVNDKNAEKVRLTTASGYAGPDEKMVDYYFGSIDERRVVWSTGRDLVFAPPAATSAPLNALPKAYVEIDGKPYAEKDKDGKAQWTRKFSYKEAK